MEKAVYFTNSKGQRLSGVIHIPVEARSMSFHIIKRPMNLRFRFPAIICCHGFGRNKIDKCRMWVRVARELCKNGFIVLRFDFSGHGDSEGEMGDITISQELDDLRAAIFYMENHWGVDKEKIGLIGHSLGGEVALLESARNERIKTLVLLAPAVDYTWLGKDFQRAVRQAQKSGYVDLACHHVKKQYFDEMQKFEPLDMVKYVSAPLLVIHGDDDESVDIGGSEKLIDVANKPKKLIIIEDADHDFFGHENTHLMIDGAVRWFREWLK